MKQLSLKKTITKMEEPKEESNINVKKKGFLTDYQAIIGTAVTGIYTYEQLLAVEKKSYKKIMWDNIPLSLTKKDIWNKVSSQQTTNMAANISLYSCLRFNTTPYYKQMGFKLINISTYLQHRGNGSFKLKR